MYALNRFTLYRVFVLLYRPVMYENDLLIPSQKMKCFLTFCICLEMSLYRNALLLKGKSSMVRSWCITNERMSKSSTFFWLQYLGHRKFSKKTRRDFSSTDANKGQKGTLLTSFFNPCKSHGKSIRIIHIHSMTRRSFKEERFRSIYLN